MSSLSKSISASLAVIIITAGVVFIALTGHRAKKAQKEKNPYEYNIEEFKKVPESVILYHEVRQIHITATNLYAIAIDTKDNVYVSADNRVITYTSEGKETGSFPTDIEARCLAVDSNQKIFLGMKTHVEVYSSKGEKLSTWTSMGNNAYFTSIASSDTDVLVADYGNRIVWRFDKDGKLLGTIGQKTPSYIGFVVPSPLFDVAIAADGSAWVANTGELRLDNFSLDGKLIKQWGRASMDLDGFSGCCNPSHFTMAADGSFITSEKGIERVKIHDAQGKLIGVVAAPSSFNEGTTGLDLVADSTGRIFILDPSKKIVRVFRKKQL